MKSAATIRLLTSSNNQTGDLFTRLMDHFFIALGYKELRHDVAKPGREIDVSGEHRTARYQMRAECKAHKRKMGGDEVGKFRGALYAEQIEAGEKKIAGYFISLGGFKQSAIEQENRLGDKGIVLVDAARIIEELETGHVLVSDVKATSQAGRCVELAKLKDAEIESIELLGHEMGYVKAVYYGHNKQLTHFALIHADGTPLAIEPAQTLIEADAESGGNLHELQYLPPAPIEPDQQELEQSALASYRKWIGDECGFIQLDGLPINEQLGPRKLQLEKLFVPLRAELVPGLNENEAVDDLLDAEQPIGDLLEATNHLALLGAPGAGKSTLLKRLATAYAFPERQAEVDDNLPEEEWLPLFLRCRELRDRTAHPIVKILEDIPAQLGMPEPEVPGFKRVLHEALRTGKVLLLVDGLDEISDEADRKNFANNLRRLLVFYPQIKMVVTSRPAGFRIVAGVIADVCHQADLSPLNEDDITALCLHWHIEVYQDTPQVREEADSLADDIIFTHSIFSLAQNPLLLTTLLVVKRSIGELPTNRAALYGEAVNVLIKTWNIEGFATLNINTKEALAQLSYIACTMMEQGIQQVSQTALLQLLKEAREVLSDELQYNRTAPEVFIEQIEYRSSLLMLTGRKVIDGELQPLYEFRHLTFQEFLAARGYVKEQHARREEELSLVELLQPHFKNGKWQEVIPLAAALAERKAEPVVRQLVEQCELVDDVDQEIEEVGLLLQCILDEVTISTKTLQAALRQLARFADEEKISEMLLNLLNGRSGQLLTELTEREYLNGNARFEDYASLLREICYIGLTGDEISGIGYEEWEVTNFCEETLEKFAKGDRRKSIEAALQLSGLSHSWFIQKVRLPAKDRVLPIDAQQQEQLVAYLRAMLVSEDYPSIHAAAWALASGLQVIRLTDDRNKELLVLLVQVWRDAQEFAVTSRMIAWALMRVNMLQRDVLRGSSLSVAEYAAFLRVKSALIVPDDDNIEAKAAALVGWYLRGPLLDHELAALVSQLYRKYEVPGRYMFFNEDQDEIRRSEKMFLELGIAGRDEFEERRRRYEQYEKDNPPLF
jgi:NACHT domain/Restriction endonuclease